MTRRGLACGCAAALLALLAGASPARASTGIGPFYVEPDATYAPIYTLLRSAKKTLDLTMYELHDPQAVQALVDDAGKGVTVRVLLDKAFSGGAVNPPAFNQLKANGVNVQWASTKVSITHQKSFVIDKKKAVIMTGNFTAQFYATARDYAVVDTKKSDVAAIEATFALDWANAAGTAPPGADLLWSPGSQNAIVATIASAKHTLRVENEELASAAVVGALAAAAQKHVDVELLMTDDKNWHTNFDKLKAAGVHVRTYKNAPHVLYIHAKAILVDGRRVLLGSQNFSQNSMQANRELGLTTSVKSVVQGVQGTFAKDFAAASPW